MSGKKDNHIVEIVAVAALVLFLFRLFRKTPKILVKEPVTTGPECENIVYQPLSQYGPVPADLIGKNWCYKGDGSFFDGKDVVYGDQYADEQVREWSEQKQTEAIQNTNRKIIQFRLINTGTEPITTKTLDTTQDQDVFDGAYEGGGIYTYRGLLNFNGSVYITLTSEPDVTGTKTIKFKLYIDNAMSVEDPGAIYVLAFGTTTSDLFHVLINKDYLFFYVKSAFTTDNKKISISSLKDTILEIEVSKTAGAISDVKVNDASQSLISHATQSISATEGSMIAANDLGNQLQNASVWDIEIVGESKWVGYPAGNTSTAWVDTIGSNNGTLIGSATTRNI